MFNSKKIFNLRNIFNLKKVFDRKSKNHKWIILFCMVTMASVLLTGCQIDYIIKSGYHQALIIKNQRSISEVLEQSQLDNEQKRKLRLILKVKDFLENDLGLKKTSNYTTYTQLEDPFVTYIVQVAYPYELKNHLWFFPIVGKVPYKGYFVKEDAEKEAKKFQSNNYDTSVRGVRAFSTLGWLKDPVLSSMLDYRDDDLVNTIIHESTHATLYVKNSANFNEQLATFIGNKGTELFYKKIEGDNSPTLKRIYLKNQDENLFSKFITTELQELEIWYKENLKSENTSLMNNPPESNEANFSSLNPLKSKRLALIQERFQKIQFHTDQYAFFKSLKLNNAILLGFKTYVNRLDEFERALEKQNGDLPTFIQNLKRLESSKDPFEDLSHL